MRRCMDLLQPRELPETVPPSSTRPQASYVTNRPLRPSVRAPASMSRANPPRLSVRPRAFRRTSVLKGSVSRPRCPARSPARMPGLRNQPQGRSRPRPTSCSIRSRRRQVLVRAREHRLYRQHLPRVHHLADVPERDEGERCAAPGRQVQRLARREPCLPRHQAVRAASTTSVTSIAHRVQPVAPANLAAGAASGGR
jgi:hypothetical protein